MNIEIGLKSRRYILHLDCVKLSLGIFFFLSCLMESFFYQLSGSTFIFVKNTRQKAANLMFCLILPVAKVPWLFIEVQFNGKTEENDVKVGSGKMKIKNMFCLFFQMLAQL